MNQNDQHKTFDQWLSAHAAIFHRVANGFAEGADRHDLVQELLLAIWKAIPAFRNDSSPATFIYRVSHNAALTWQRTQRNYRKKIDQFESLVPFDSQTPAPDASHELLDRLYAEIRKLAPVDRSLILLSLDNVTYREMAAIHGLSESNVGVRLNRLKQKLAENMKGFAHELR